MRLKFQRISCSVPLTLLSDEQLEQLKRRIADREEQMKQDEPNEQA